MRARISARARASVRARGRGRGRADRAHVRYGAHEGTALAEGVLPLRLRDRDWDRDGHVDTIRGWTCRRSPAA